MIAGWVDWARTVAPSGALRIEQRPDGVRGVSGPGFDVAVAGPNARIALAGALVVVATGDPRFAAEPGQGDAAERWLERVTGRGEGAVAGARGRYAVICLDLARRGCFLATDRFAAWPLCYAVEDTRLAFSDRADRVPTLGQPELDPQAIFDYVYFHVIPAPRTIFRGVNRLDAGEMLTFDGREPRLQRHWIPKFVEDAPADFASLKNEFRRRLEAAVARDASAGEIGCFLSGGTDSSTVAGVTTQVTGKPVRTFSIGFDAQGYDEIEYARIAARHFGTDHHEYYVRPEDLIDGIPKLARQYDQPFGNSSAAAAYCCARVARDAGVRILLAGDGGDELFGGNTRYAKQRVFGAYERIPGAMRSTLLEPVLLGVPGVKRLPLARKVASYVAQARVPMPDRMNTYNLLHRLGMEVVLQPELLDSIDPRAVDEQQRAVYERCDTGSLVNRMLAYDWKYTLADNDLPKVRETAHLAGVGVRFPLLDDDLLDFSLALPPDLKVRGLKLRYFFKEALRGFLPDEIIAKPKHGFGLPFGVWLTQHQGLRVFVADTLGGLRDRGIVRREFLDGLVDGKIREHPGYYGEMVWILAMLEQWLRARALAADRAALAEAR